jgi:hypothetical protein
MTMLAPLVPKLVRLIPRLASNHDGEIVATVKAIGRVLESSGLDFHDLAHAVSHAPPPRWRELESEQAAIDICLTHPQALNDWERRFLAGIASQDFALSPRQCAVLDQMVRKVRAFVMAGAAP